MCDCAIESLVCNALNNSHVNYAHFHSLITLAVDSNDIKRVIKSTVPKDSWKKGNNRCGQENCVKVYFRNKKLKKSKMWSSAAKWRNSLGITKNKVKKCVGKEVEMKGWWRKPCLTVLFTKHRETTNEKWNSVKKINERRKKRFFVTP